MGAYTAAVLADNPRHYWRCADPGGFYLHDIGSTPHALGMQANVSLATPYSGPNSDGGSAYINGAGNAWWLTTETFAGPVTIECWFWQQQRLPTPQYCLAIDTAGHTIVLAALYLEVGVPKLQGSTATRAAAAAAATEQHWHHLVGTIDVAGNGILYLDAINVGSAVVGAGGSASYQLAMGGTSPNASGLFDGSLAELAIYPTVLSPSRINAHFLAADNTASRPVFKAFGEFNISTAVTTLDSDTLAKVLAAVQKTFPTT